MRMSDEDATYASLEYLNLMSDEEKVGQLFNVNLELLDQTKGQYYELKSLQKAMKETLEQYPVGGVTLFSEKYLEPEADQKADPQAAEEFLTHRCLCVWMRKAAMWHGSVNNPKMKTDTFPSMEEIGKTEDADYVYYMAEDDRQPDRRAWL